MMVEKQLEDYICNNQEQFINFIKKNIYGEDCDIKFIGRQVRLGNDNIIDLLYYYDDEYCGNNAKDIKITEYCRTYIVVELKIRELEPKDFSQLGRYMEILENKFSSEDKYLCRHNFVKRIFVSLGCNNLTRNMQMLIRNNADIDFIKINTKVEYEMENYCYNDDYIQNIKLDERIEKMYEE